MNRIVDSIVVVFGFALILMIPDPGLGGPAEPSAGIETAVVEPPLHESIGWYAQPDRRVVLVYMIEGKFYGFPHAIRSIDPVAPDCREKVDRGTEWVLNTQTVSYTVEAGPVEPLKFDRICKQYDYQNLRCRVRE
ncbi:MAG: hypothetical protein GWO11_00025 [Desulfuromonadales bacterium]|nr:hypothetical protein [Desulfuromonadales bacterium]NIR53204.1 hypothetical protein [Nitrospinaceae bacterium]NIS83599.1 hypothetical protein [Nitrospinaceae bacterium]NIT80389.1 hypothetical protein [Nitrospinaceae bacterium]NIU42732.1 hypothetical protein [Nitrospinaceae bacterium]